MVEGLELLERALGPVVDDEPQGPEHGIARGAARSSSSRTHRSRRPNSVRLAFRVIPIRSQKYRMAAGG